MRMLQNRKVRAGRRVQWKNPSTNLKCQAKLAKLSKAILTTLSSDDEDDQSSISSKDSDKKPAQKKKK